MRISLACAAVVLAGAPGAFAWGAAGHEIVATIAQMHLHPDVLPVLCDILDPSAASFSNTSDPAAHPPCHLAPIAAWADRVRMSPAYRHTATWHYVGAKDDSPGTSCAFPGAHGWNGRRDSNVLAALGNQTRVVAEFLDGEGGLADAADALKFLVHFAGDMHMPLHLTGRERGGNGAKVTFDGRMTSKYPSPHSQRRTRFGFWRYSCVVSLCCTVDSIAPAERLYSGRDSVIDVVQGRGDESKMQARNENHLSTPKQLHPATCSGSWPPHYLRVPRMQSLFPKGPPRAWRPASLRVRETLTVISSTATN